MKEGRYRLIGSTASPYAIKMRALLRYRRIPFDWVIMTKALRKQTQHLRPNLIPVLQYPDGTFRSLRPGSPASGSVGHSERQGSCLCL
jgi:glutathione S-transferase